MKILLVEDEKELSAVIKKGLEKSAYVVDTAYDGKEALDMLFVNSYNLVVLDLNLPLIDGLAVLKELRQKNQEIKVIILSTKNQIEDKVAGLELGSNDYLEKPFDFKELLARVDNLLRWSFIRRDTIIQYDRLKIDTAKKVAYVDDQDIKLTTKEYGILEYLAYNDNRIVSGKEIMEHVWHEEADVLFSTSFNFHMSSLRKKINIHNIIKNVRGRGYFLNTGADHHAQ